MKWLIAQYITKAIYSLYPMATNLPPNSAPYSVRCHLCNLLVKSAALTGHINQNCFARPKPGQQISPGTCPHCLAAVPVIKMETHLLHSCHALTVPCPFCQYRFQYIEQHLRKKHSEKERTKLFQQLRNTPNPYSAKKSPASKHTPSYSDLKQPECPFSRSSCPICHTYMREKKLRSHVKSHFKIQCPFCKNNFNKSGLVTHLVNKCLSKNASSNSAGVVKCPICKKQDSISKIAQHLALSHLTLCCPICSGILDAKRITSHLNMCSGKSESPSLSQSPLRHGVFQKFRELGGNDDVYSGSEGSLTDEDSSDEDEFDYVYDTPVTVKSRGNSHSGSHHKSKPFHAPFLDPTDPNYVLLPADHQRRGGKGGYTEDLVSAPYISMGHKISCPICNSDCPLRMMGRHIVENHITHQCPICKHKLANSSFKVHLEECMGRYGAKDVKGRPTYPCPYCSQAKCHSVREISTHIHRTHRQLNCPFCQDSYGPHNYCRHVSKCARLSVMSAQLIQDNPHLDPEMIQLYQQLQIESSEGSSYSEDELEETPLPEKQLSREERRDRSSAYLAEESYTERSGRKVKQETKDCCFFCHFQCCNVPLEDHLAECKNIPNGMQVVSMGNLLGLRINSTS